jgi:leader peptidase (prepilin peptidase)/N-methyltransferase
VRYFDHTSSIGKPVKISTQLATNSVNAPSFPALLTITSTRPEVPSPSYLRSPLPTRNIIAKSRQTGHLANVDPLLAAVIFALGLAFGSFLNVCIYRLPLGKSVVTPRSACPHCGKGIPLYHNLPVLSWLVLRGKCSECKEPISPRYLVVELLTGLLFLGCYSHFGLSLAMLKCIVLGYLLLGLIFTDAETKLLPDALTLPGLALGIVFSLLVPVNDLASRIMPGLVSLPVSGEVSWRLWSLADSALGAAVGASFLYGAAAIYLRARGVEGMGFGDVKLMAMIGAFLGTRLTVLTIFAASLAGSLFGVSTVLAVWIKRTRRNAARGTSSLEARRRAWQSARTALRYYEMPFGVFLGSMALLAFFFGNDLLHWYWGLL